MTEYRQIEGSVDVPKGTGVEGFLRSVREILTLPRIQSIHIDGRGKITYTHFLRDGEEVREPSIDFESLTPYAMIRNVELVEIPNPREEAAVAVGQLFRAASLDHLHPMAFVGGASSKFWEWYERSTESTYENRDEFFGLPFLVDRHLGDDVLVLACSYIRRGALADVRRSYKLLIPGGLS